MALSCRPAAPLAGTRCVTALCRWGAHVCPVPGGLGAATPWERGSSYAVCCPRSAAVGVAAGVAKLFCGKLCHAVPCCPIPSQAAPPCAIPCQDELCCCAMPCCAFLCNVMLCRATPCCDKLCRAMLFSSTVLCHFIPSYSMLCSAMPCCDELCCAMPCHAVLFHPISFHAIPFYSMQCHITNHAVA